MNKNNAFQPDWVSPPGDTIADVLEERNLPPDEFARRIGRSSRKHRVCCQAASG